MKQTQNKRGFLADMRDYWTAELRTYDRLKKQAEQARYRFGSK